MKLPIEWAKSYAEFSCTPQEFSDRMTMSGSKVETYFSEADKMDRVVVGRIAELHRMENSDHLWICQVDVGAETLQIVTGAQNLRQGDLCPVALHGAKLPGGTEIKRGKLRGHKSEGMLCSLPELGLTSHDFPEDSEEGILILHGEFALGTDAAPALGMDGEIFEFEITPNRPDCLSVRGLAREAAATFGVPFKDISPSSPKEGKEVDNLISVELRAADTCYRYSCAVVDNVRIGPSPAWMRRRLRQAGVRPINNIVDITNYVMLEYGQPMHAFDYAYVNGQKITVRKAGPGENIVTLDGEKRVLDESMMVIADEKGPIAIAGVMGGEFSGVYDSTQKVVFESASFNGPSVRATSRKIALRTESSTRFEKGLDPETVGPALARALELVTQLDAGDVVPGVLDAYPAPVQPRSIPLNPGAVNALLGIELPESEMVDILTPLGFRVEGGQVHIPSFRADVARDCDIAEEIARFVGYNKIPSTILTGAAQARPSDRQTFERRVEELLTGYGFWGCATFSFYSPAAFDMIRLPEESPLRSPVRLLHPLGEETSIMRTTALPSILEVAGRNWASRNDGAALYELATTYHPNPPADLPDEKQVLVLAAYGGGWDYLALKGALEALFDAFRLPAVTFRPNSEGVSYHPGRCADASLTGGEGEEIHLAVLGELHPQVADNYGIRARVVAAEIDVEALFAARGPVPQFQHLPKFPAITRDLALVTDDDRPAADIAALITKGAGKRLESLTLFDIYKGDKIPEGKKSLAYSLVLRDAEATLTDADADAIVNKVLAMLAPTGVVLRT